NFNNNGGNTFGTAFDLHSIMNYSYDQGQPNCLLPRPFRLSPWDIVGVRNAYGRRPTGELVADSGGCIDIPLPYSLNENLQLYECNNGPNQNWRMSGNYIWDPSYSSAGLEVTNGAGIGALVAVGSSPSMSYFWRASGVNGSAAGYQLRGV